MAEPDPKLTAGIAATQAEMNTLMAGRPCSVLIPVLLASTAAVVACGRGKQDPKVLAASLAFELRRAIETACANLA